MTRIARSTRAFAWSLLLAVLLMGCDRPQVMNPQFMRDTYLAYSIGPTILAANDQVRDSYPPGDVDLDLECEQGTIRITGTLSETDLEYEHELEYDLSACEISQSFDSYSVTATLSGKMTVTGSWDKFSNQNGDFEGSDQILSDDLRMVGDQLYEGHPSSFDNECLFEYIKVVNSTSEAFLGEICGRPFSHSLSHKG